MSHHVEDDAIRALTQLKVQMERTVGELQAAGTRLEHVAGLRASGHSWIDIVSNEDRPLIVETITRALDDLGAVGGRFRRQEALALQRDGASITRISQLFGVSRQRISAIVRGNRAPSAAEETSRPISLRVRSTVAARGTSGMGRPEPQE